MNSRFISRICGIFLFAIWCLDTHGALCCCYFCLNLCSYFLNSIFTLILFCFTYAESVLFLGKNIMKTFLRSGEVKKSSNGRKTSYSETRHQDTHSFSIQPLALIYNFTHLRLINFHLKVNSRSFVLFTAFVLTKNLLGARCLIFYSV